MRTLEINKQEIKYASYVNKTEIIDEYDNPTGQYILNYANPVAVRVSVSAATGIVSRNPFGDLEDYDKVIMHSNMTLPITESTRLWVDSLDTTKPHDYIVRKVARSMNGVSLAISKVNVSV